MDTRITLLPMTEAYAPGAARLDQITFPGEAWSEEAFLREAPHPLLLLCSGSAGGRSGGLCGYAAGAGRGVYHQYRCGGVLPPKGSGTGYARRSHQPLPGERDSFLTLEVRQSNAPAIALYESMGFLPEGRRKNFYRQPTEDAILMTKRDLSL